MANHLSINAGELQTHISRLHHLAIAADCLNSGSMVGEPQRGNCVIYLIDTIEYLSEQAVELAGDLQIALERGAAE